MSCGAVQHDRSVAAVHRRHPASFIPRERDRISCPSRPLQIMPLRACPQRSLIFIPMKPLHIETPLFESRALTIGAGRTVWLKIEAMQPRGSLPDRRISGSP
jgi:hypothetical protein